jgi:hypothetical protein
MLTKKQDGWDCNLVPWAYTMTSVPLVSVIQYWIIPGTWNWFRCGRYVTRFPIMHRFITISLSLSWQSYRHGWFNKNHGFVYFCGYTRIAFIMHLGKGKQSALWVTSHSSWYLREAVSDCVCFVWSLGLGWLVLHSDSVWSKIHARAWTQLKNVLLTHGIFFLFWLHNLECGCN